MRPQCRHVLLASIAARSILAANLGQWSAAIDFPLVPVAGSIDPSSGHLLVWAAFRNDTFKAGAANVTQTAVYSPDDGSVQYFRVQNTEHDMFCPGTSLDFNGNFLVTGGDTSSATSMFDRLTKLGSSSLI